MENNKREWPPVRRPRRRGFNIRPVAMVLALVLLVGAAVGGTIAWLIDDTDPIANTFTVGNIDIALTETFNTDSDGDQENDKWFGKMVPGCTIDKDPKVTVVGGSEDCWLFVEVVESTNLDSFINYEVADGWKELSAGIYYREVAASDIDQKFGVLKDDEVSVLAGVTKDMMDAIEDGSATSPTLTFTAYAIQQAGLTDQNTDGTVDAVDAWKLISS